METIYENFGFDYLVYNDNSYRYIVQRVLAPLSPAASIRILELGCGSAAFSRFFLEDSRVRLTGIDISQKLVDIAANAYGGERAMFLCGKVGGGLVDSLGGERFDVVFSGAFLHHLGHAARKEVLGAFGQLVRPGGLAAFFEPNRDNPAIAFQYTYETWLNSSQYDREESPLRCSRVRRELPAFREAECEFLDVVYRPLPTGTNEPVIRYGWVGRLLYRIGSSAFRPLYGWLKRSPLPSRFTRDYFLAILAC